MFQSKEDIQALKVSANRNHFGMWSSAVLLGVIDFFEYERSVLLQQIERSVDEQQLPVIPREVAGAISSLKLSGLDNYTIITNLAVCSWKSQDCKAFNALLEFDRNALMNALVLGYTIEEPERTTEEKIEAAVLEVYKKWASEPPSTSDSGFVTNREEENRDLARRITLRVREILIEERDYTPD